MIGAPPYKTALPRSSVYLFSTIKNKKEWSARIKLKKAETTQPSAKLHLTLIRWKSTMLFQKNITENNVFKQKRALKLPSKIFLLSISFLTHFTVLFYIFFTSLLLNVSECDTSKCDNAKIERITFGMWGIVYK